MSNNFQEYGYVVVKNFIDAQTVSTVSKYLENFLKRYPENNGASSRDSSKIAWYADPLVEILLDNYAEKVSEVTEFNVVPTYSYTRVYTKGDELEPHVDRPSCEISVTCHIATVGDPWPIYMQAPGGVPTKHYLEPGDACVYKGCEIKHWREVAKETDVNVQVMLHYVNAKGPNADFKFDRRPSLSVKK